MNLYISKFDDKQIEKNGIGAGIIPISVDKNNNIYILLAKESFNPLWKQSCKWSGFEGGRKTNETIIETAIREYKEESLDIIKFPSSIEDIIKNKEYNIRLVINIQQEKLCIKYHSTYVIEVPWQPDCILLFEKVRYKLITIKKYAEILNNISEMVFKYKINTREDIGIIKSITNIEIKTKNMITLHMLVENDNIIKRCKIDTKLVEPLLLWQYIRQSITFMIGDFKHKSLNIKKDYDNIIYNIEVNEDYLEKEKMKWWDIETLKKVLKNGGYHDSEYFKSYFMPVLQGLLESIE